MEWPGARACLVCALATIALIMADTKPTLSAPNTPDAVSDDSPGTQLQPSKSMFIPVNRQL
jgi:hypothetical protein